MNPEVPPTPREQLETRITALLLGELPPEEAAALRQVMEVDPELNRFAQRLARAIELVKEVSAGPAAEPAPAAPLKLSAPRRQQLFQRFKVLTPPKVSARTPRRLPWLVPAAFVAVLMGLLLLALPAMHLSKAKSRAMAQRGQTTKYFADSSMLQRRYAAVPAAKEPQEQQVRERLLSFGNATADAPAGSLPSGGRPTTTVVLPAVVPDSGQLAPTAHGGTTAGEGVTALFAADSENRAKDLAAVAAAADKAVIGEKQSLGYNYSVSPTVRGFYDATDTDELEKLGRDLKRNSQEANLAVKGPEGRSWFGGFGGGAAGGGLGGAGGGGLGGFRGAGGAAGVPGATRAPEGQAQEPAKTLSDQFALFLKDSSGAVVSGGELGVERFKEAELPPPATPPAVAITPAPALATPPPVGVVTAPAASVAFALPVTGLPANQPVAPAEKVPVLGEVPAVGRLFRSDKAKVAEVAQVEGKQEAVVAGRFELAGKSLETLETARTTLHFDDTAADGVVSDKPAAASGVELRRGGVPARQLADAGDTLSAAQTEAVPRVAHEKYDYSGNAVLPSQVPEPSKGVGSNRKRLATAPESTARPMSTNFVPVQSQLAEQDRSAGRPAIPPAQPLPEIQTVVNRFSTFSLNISDVSMKLAAASLEKGVMPDPAAIRSEEFLNAFDYRDPAPAPGVPIAFACDRARSPFAQNRDLLRFSIKTAAQGRQAGRPLNLVLLLDNSGSMERADRVRIIREALRVLAAQLQPQDMLSIVTFARTGRLWVDGLPGGAPAVQAIDQVSRLTPEGGTNLEDAMNLAYQTAVRHYLPAGINRVVLLTDGAANLGNVDPDALKAKAQTYRRQGIALDCFGIGWEGYNDDLLEVLARNGDGRYGFLNAPEEAPTEFAGRLAGALQVAASDVKVQVEFNPARVAAYRQVGYAKLQLTKEQFRDNTVDAAEIGAEESGNALYVIETQPDGQGPIATVRVRYKVPGTLEYREHEYEVPYTGPAVALDQAGPAMRLAAVASAFAEWLASSPYAADVTPDRLLTGLAGVPDAYGADPRPRKLEWMIRQAKSLSGK